MKEARRPSSKPNNNLFDIMPSINAAKVNFFRSHDPFVNYYPSVDRTTKGGGSSTANRRYRCRTGTSTIYASAFSPSTSSDRKKYFVACTSNGCIVVWDYQASKYEIVGPSIPVLT